MATATTYPTIPADLTERCLALFTAGMRTADDLTLSHEAERLETLPTSPVVAGMRQIVAVEQHTRRSCAPLEAAT